MIAAQKATQQQTRTYNSQLVLKTIYDQESVSRAEVARLTELTRTTVSDLVAELQEKGLVEESGPGQSGGGRAPILLRVVEDARLGISLDLANDEFRGAVVTLRNRAIHTRTRLVPGRGGAAALAELYGLIDDLRAAADRPLLGIGVGTPGLVDTQRGIVVRAVNLDWQDLPLGRLLTERYGIPAHVANDSQLAALAHYMFDTESAAGSLAMIKIGHGIGAGLILGGRLFQGEGFGAGEIGHLTVVEGGVPCRCGNHGCLETVASTGALVRRAQAAAQAHPGSQLARAAAAGDLTVQAIAAAAAAGDAPAQALVAETGRYLGIAVAALVSVLNIGHIVLAGSVIPFGEPLLVALRGELGRRALPTLVAETRVELAADRPDVVIRGATALLLTHELGLSLVR